MSKRRSSWATFASDEVSERNDLSGESGRSHIGALPSTAQPPTQNNELRGVSLALILNRIINYEFWVIFYRRLLIYVLFGKFSVLLSVWFSSDEFGR